MDNFSSISQDKSWWIFTLPAIIESQKYLFNTSFLFCVFLLMCVIFITTNITGWAFSSGGPAWKNGRQHTGRVAIPVQKGLPIFGSLFSLSHGLPHRTLASISMAASAKQLLAFSLGSTPAVVTSHPQIAKEILTSPHFANRPVKQSAKQLMFSRAIGFAPDGPYWRFLRKISSSHLFSPKRILAHEVGRQLECAAMVKEISKEQFLKGKVELRKHLQTASLNNIMKIVFGKKYEVNTTTADNNDQNREKDELNEIVREAFELLGSFNWSDHLPWLNYFCFLSTIFDPFRVQQRCLALVPRVKKLVKQIMDEHLQEKTKSAVLIKDDHDVVCDENSNFLDVLLSLEGEEKLSEDDTVAVLWEMIFRGTDTTALLTEWIMAELVLHPKVQSKLFKELENVIGNKCVTDSDVPKLPYLEAVVKETLRLHPPGPLLSWARLSTADVQLSTGMVIPANTVAMVNMWAITHDSQVWDDPLTFKPERFLACEGGVNVDVRGHDLRLAPFGAGRRVCPGKNLGLAIVNLWVAKLVQEFQWFPSDQEAVDMSEVLKLSSEMKKPLSAMVVPRSTGAAMHH